uniref:Uncharacterized protein n=1 Tax=Anguilla anguilla TaxID=7936 RepID=A0A0E9XPA6_ANGAN
MQGAQERFGGN